MSSVDYCFTEVMVAIGQNYWRCITCQVQFTRHMSIDKHVHLKHGSSTSLSNHSVISSHESSSPEKSSSDSITAFSMNVTPPLNMIRLEMGENCVNTAKGPLHSRDSNKPAVLFSGSEGVKTVVDLPSIQILSESKNRINDSETGSHISVENDHLWVRNCQSSFSNNDLNQTSVNQVEATDLNVLHEEQHAMIDSSRDPSQITDSHRKRDNFEHDRIDEDIEGDEANKNMVDSLLGVLEKSMDIDGLGGVMQTWELNPELFEQQLLNNTSDISIDSLNTSSKEKTNGDSLLGMCRKSPNDCGDHLPDDKEPDDIVAESEAQNSSGLKKCNNADSIDGISNGSFPHSMNDSNSEVYDLSGDDSCFEVEQLYSLLDSDSSGSISSIESSSDSESADVAFDEEVKCNSFAAAGRNKTIVNQFAGLLKNYLKLCHGKTTFMDQPFQLKDFSSKGDSTLRRDIESSNENSSLTSLSPEDIAGTWLSTLPDHYECNRNTLNQNTVQKTASHNARSPCIISCIPHNKSGHSSSLYHALGEKTAGQAFIGVDVNQTVLCDSNKLLKDKRVNVSTKDKQGEKVKSNIKEKYHEMSKGNGQESKMEENIGKNKGIEQSALKQTVYSQEENVYTHQESIPSVSKRRKSEVEMPTQLQGTCKRQVEHFSDKYKLSELCKEDLSPFDSVSKMKYEKSGLLCRKRKHAASLTSKQLSGKDPDKHLALSDSATSVPVFKSRKHCARRRQRKHTKKLSGCDIRNLRQEVLISLNTKPISCIQHKTKRTEEKGQEYESKDENKRVSHLKDANTSLTDGTSSHDLISVSKEAEASVVFPTAAGSNHLCNICDRRFSTTSARNRHLKVNSMSSDTCKCKVCSMKFHSLLQLNIHIYRTHETQGRPICFKCNTQHSTLRNLTRHIQKHKNELVLEQMKQQPFSTKALKTWKCDICGVYFRNCQSVILAHTRKHTKERPHKCPQCDKKFSTVAALNVHAATHSGRMYHCDLCDQSFKNKTSRHYHKLTHASVKGEFLCQVCGQMFEFEHKLTAHVKVHSQPKKIRPTFKCTDCDKVYKIKKNLVRHVEVDHKGIKDYDYKCEHCDQQFFASWQLRDHITWRHLGEKPYHCAYCGQGFVCRPTLIRHQRNVHTGVKPYKCQFCDEAFVEKKNLDLHEAKVHTGVYPLSCSHCGKGFVVSSSLKEHEAMHLDERPHQCHLCGKRFLKANHLTRHSKGCAKRNGPISFVYSMGRLSHDSLAPAAPPLPIMTGEAMAASIYSL